MLRYSKISSVYLINYLSIININNFFKTLIFYNSSNFLILNFMIYTY